MSKTKDILKKAIFFWGVVSLVLLAGLVVFVWISNITSDLNARRPEETVIHENSSGNIKFIVKRKSGGGKTEILLSLLGRDKPLVRDYRLQVDEHTLFDNVRESKMLEAGPNAWRILLVSSTADCDEATQHLYFLRYDGALRLVHTEELTDMLERRDGSIIGNQQFFLQPVDGLGDKKFIVPVEITVGETISVKPFLNDHGRDVFKSEFEDRLAERDAEIRKWPEKGQYEYFTATCKSFNETLAGKSIAW